MILNVVAHFTYLELSSSEKKSYFEFISFLRAIGGDLAGRYSLVTVEDFRGSHRVYLEALARRWFFRESAILSIVLLGIVVIAHHTDYLSMNTGWSCVVEGVHDDSDIRMSCCFGDDVTGEALSAFLDCAHDTSGIDESGMTIPPLFSKSMNRSINCSVCLEILYAC
jgi:hypothetical protein